MKTCPKCDQEISGDERRCRKCGEGLDRDYGSLLSASRIYLVCGFLGFVACLLVALVSFATMELPGTVLFVLAGVGLLVSGFIVDGLVRLATDVAEDIRCELHDLNEKAGVHTRLLAELANNVNPVESH
jgi:hypothetical protein